MRIRIVVAVGLAAALTGCGGPTIAPSSERAGQALETVLNAWKAGKPCGRIEGVEPALVVVDSAWQGGKKLDAFEVIGPVDGSTPPRIRVKLSHGAPSKPEEATYVLVGDDPLYIYRDADFDRMLNMDNNPTPGR